MMNYHSIGRNQRTKGFKVKQALQFTLFLAICIWLLYQIKNSHDEKKYHGGSVQNKLVKERSAISLGRKGSAGWSKDRVDSDLGDVNPMRETRTKEDGSAGDDEIDRNPIEKKAEAESYIKESENVATREEGELQTFEDSTSGIQEVNLNKDMYKDDFSSKGHEQSNEKNPEKLVKDKDEAVKYIDEDRGPMKIAARLGGIVNVTAPGQSETEGEVRSFHDETGVPQDDSDESSQTKSNYDLKSNLNRETISISYTRSRMVGEDVESKEGSVSAYAGKENKVTSEDSKNDITTDAEVGLDSSGELSVNHAVETVHENSTDSEDSHSVSSQQKFEEVNGTSMLRASDKLNKSQ